MSDSREDLIDIELWQCEVCNYSGFQGNITNSREECGMETTVECPSCSSIYCEGEVISRTEGEICAFCGEFVEEIIKVQNGGSQPDMICKECDNEQNWEHY